MLGDRGCFASGVGVMRTGAPRLSGGVCQEGAIRVARDCPAVLLTWQRVLGSGGKRTCVPGLRPGRSDQR